MSEQNSSKNNSPYLNARKEWVERYGDIIKSKNRWLIATYLSIITSIIAVSAYIYKSNEQTVIPYIIQTNSLGEVTQIFKADIAAKPNTSHIKAALANWIKGTRTIYVDYQAESDIIKNTYAYTMPQSAAYNMLADYHQSNDPFKEAANKTVDIQIDTIFPITGDSWQINWIETTRTRAGRVISTENWQAIVTITFAKPQNESQIYSNPIGLYVKQFSWEKRI